MPDGNLAEVAVDPPAVGASLAGVCPALGRRWKRRCIVARAAKIRLINVNRLPDRSGGVG
jgi:hypothetical protein